MWETFLKLISSHALALGTADTLRNVGDGVSSLGSLENIAQSGLHTFIVVGWMLVFVLFAWGGFSYLISAGNPDGTRKAVRTMIWAAIGLLIMLTAYTITKFVFPEIFNPSGDFVNKDKVPGFEEYK